MFKDNNSVTMEDNATIQWKSRKNGERTIEEERKKEREGEGGRERASGRDSERQRTSMVVADAIHR